MDDPISRAAAIEHMKEMAGCATCNNYNYVRCRACSWDDAMNIIEDLPAVDAVPVVHGKWQWLSSTYDRTPCEMRYWCSECHHETITHSVPPWEKYCPNCGAKMDGEQEGK